MVLHPDLASRVAIASIAQDQMDIHLIPITMRPNPKKGGQRRKV